MATRAAFIGIDRHADPTIRDLTGAARDATALWALFGDSVPLDGAALLHDDQATAANIRGVLQGTLGSGGLDDTVVLSFSGHGTRDHRLVAHDTRRDALHASTIPMEELAAAFTVCQARAILCILDCCFSGGAPARVLEDSPVSRDPVTALDILAGKGRVLLAACNVNETAFESPLYRHGLLTKALIDVLLGLEGQTSIGTALDGVLERVRAEAARMGVTQTPVMLGYVEGGLLLPKLIRGAMYFRAFPELRGATVGPAIGELKALGLPGPILDAWSERFSAGLNALQLRAVNDCRVLEGEPLLVVAPTSSGKTFIGEMAATRAVADRRKAVFLLPYKALVNEKYDDFQALYGAKLRWRVIRCTGDYQDDTAALLRGKYDLALLTYEMFLNLAVSNAELLHSLGLVVLDEAQFITDPTRGIAVELLLTHILAARERGIAPQLIALSAVIGHVNDFDAWLGTRLLVTTDRPVPLVEGVIDRSGRFRFVGADGMEGRVQMLAPGVIQMRREKPGAQDVLVPLVQKLVAAGENVIVFRNRRGPAEGCAKYLARDLGLPAATVIIGQLPQHDPTTSSAQLQEALRGGTAFHNANLTREERVVVEQAFREGAIRVLVATTTVAAGINTPADTVIIAEQEFVGDDGRPFTIAEYKNMAGRAGRLGFSASGKAIIVAETDMDAGPLFDRYVLGRPEPLRSSFDDRDVETWLLRLFAQEYQVERSQVVRLLANTFGGYVAIRDDPAWRDRMAADVEGLLRSMTALELLEEEGDRVQLTLLGRACGCSQLALRSAMRLVEMLRQIGGSRLTAVRLMGLLQMLREADGGYTPVMKRGRKEAQWPAEAARAYGDDVARALQRYAEDEFDYFGRCKRAALLHAWISGMPLTDIEERFTATPFQGKIGHGDVRRFADLTRMILRSAHQIAGVMFLGTAVSDQDVEKLLRRLEVGIPESGLELLHLGMTLTRGEHLALVNAGMGTAAAVWAAPPERLIELFGNRRAQELERMRPESTAGLNETRRHPRNL